MIKKISNNFIKELISLSDIVEIVSKYIYLKKIGNNYKGYCPFHKEKTPSFFVNSEKKIYHCFGCHEYGDVLTFIKKINNIKFTDSVKNLAEIIGINIKYENYSKEDIKKEKIYTKCINFLKIIQKYYLWNLNNSINKNIAINYLKKRKITSNIIKLFGIGYSFIGLNNINKIAESLNIEKEILFNTGLIIKKNNKVLYDRFRNRIMFPIKDIQGNIIAYGGRVIDDSQEIKYINSPDSLIFKKNSILYGLYEYRKYKKEYPNLKHENIILVEGYMDVVSLAKHGCYTAVAVLGTSLSLNHVKILFRETNSIILCFDGDKAGQEAVFRSIKIILPLLEGNKVLRIVTLPNNNDPDDYIQLHGIKNFYNILSNSINAVEFIVNKFIKNKNLNEPESKAEIVDNLKKFLFNMTDNIYSESIISSIANKININIDLLKNLLKIPKKKLIYINKQKNLKKRILSKNLLLEEIMLSELLINPLDFGFLKNISNFEIFPVSKRLYILVKALKILKEDLSNQIESILFIQLLSEDYPDYREYFFELLSYGKYNTQKKYAGNQYQAQMINMLKRIEHSSIKKKIKYLNSLPFITNIQEIERKYLLAKLINCVT